jgi:large subunit ribosomal protein L25
MEAVKLHGEPRSLTGKHVKRLRAENLIPGIVYGRRIDPIAVQFEHHDLNLALHRAGTSTTVEVDIEGDDEQYLAIFRDIQHHPIRRNVIHVDLQALSLDETVQVPVPVVTVGIAPATEEAGGVLNQPLNELAIEALPMALIPVIEIDISGLTEIGDSITVADIEVPEGITILNAPTETIVQVTFMEEEDLEPEEELEPLEGELGLLGEEMEMVEGEEGELVEGEEEEGEEERRPDYMM